MTEQEVNFTFRQLEDFKIGDEVKYVSNSFGDFESDPLWNGRYGRMIGTIAYIERNRKLENVYPIKVYWSNGRINRYRSDDLEFVVNQEFILDDIDDLFEIGK